MPIYLLLSANIPFALTTRRAVARFADIHNEASIRHRHSSEAPQIITPRAPPGSLFCLPTAKSPSNAIRIEPTCALSDDARTPTVHKINTRPTNARHPAHGVISVHRTTTQAIKMRSVASEKQSVSAQSVSAQSVSAQSVSAQSVSAQSVHMCHRAELTARPLQ